MKRKKYSAYDVAYYALHLPFLYFPVHIIYNSWQGISNINEREAMSEQLSQKTAPMLPNNGTIEEMLVYKKSAEEYISYSTSTMDSIKQLEIEYVQLKKEVGYDGLGAVGGFILAFVLHDKIMDWSNYIAKKYYAVKNKITSRRNK